MAKTHRASGRTVVTKDEQILLTKFMNGKYFNFPGGEVKEGETLAECAKREVLKESGITVGGHFHCFFAGHRPAH